VIALNHSTFYLIDLIPNSKIGFWLRWLCSTFFIFPRALCLHNGRSLQTKNLRSRFAKILTFEPFSVLFIISFGQIAQSVEQRTENPCVAGSIPVLAIFSKKICQKKSHLRGFCLESK
jgi:hypothetical protein